MTECNTNHEERIHLFLTINQRSDAPSSRCDQNILWKGFIIMKLTTIQVAKIAARQKIFEFIKQRIESLFEKKDPSSTR